MKLYEIPIEAMQIEQELSENYGELTPEIEQRIADFLGDGKEKIESAAVVAKSLESDAEVCQLEAKRLMERASGLNKAVDRLKGLILVAVDQGFGGKLKTAKFTIWGQTSAPTTAFELRTGADIYELMISEPWCIRKRDPELDKIALRDARKAGKEIPPDITAIDNDGTRFLRIK